MATVKRLRLKKPFDSIGRVLLTILLILFAIFLFYRYEIHTIKVLGYSEKAANEILFSWKKNYVEDIKFSKTLNKAFESDDYNEKYLKKYSLIDYYDSNLLIKNINTLLKKGYTILDINLLFSRGTQEEVKEFSKRDRVLYLEEFLEYDFAKLRLYDEYKKYSDDSGDNAYTSIVYVNLGYNNSDYKNPTIVKEFKKDMLVNKTLARTVVVIDNIAPELTLEKTKVSIYTNGVINYGKIKASDNIDGDISKSVIVNNNIDTSESGKYKIDVSVSDSSGNETVKQIDVTIKEKPVKNGKTVNARIDVYISEQKLYYFENNKLVLTSDVVTGKKDGTPRGNYKVLRKKKDIYLKGDTFLDHVDYWIAFIGGLYGIHDASWRSEFGGDIYKKNGSHGCVNMPVDNMKKLYEKVKVGTAVNIYD